MNLPVYKTNRRQHGLTLVELMVALAIGSFLIIGAVQIYNQSRHAFVINESIARVQETANFAMDTIEADLRMASNWGRTSRGLSIEGRSLAGDVNPLDLNVPLTCGEDWVLDLGTPVDGNNNVYSLTCPPDDPVNAPAQANSDVITVRRSTVNPAPLQAGRIQIQTTRVQGQLFDNGNVPGEFSTAINPVTGQPDSTTHNLMVTSYYVATDSPQLIPGAPTLRRKTLVMQGANTTVTDQEVAPGVENIQLQLGLDVNDDNAVDRYVNPGDESYNPEAPGYIPGAKVVTARIWLVVRGLSPEVGNVDTRQYTPGDVNLGTYADEYRRQQISKTILLRNART